MSVLDQDFSSDLQKAEIIGGIKNTYHYLYTLLRGMSFISYTPYNLILTNNSIFGEHLAGPSGTIHTGILAPFFDSKGKVNTLREYITNGKIIKDIDKSKLGKIDVKIDYDKIKRITLNVNLRTQGIFAKEDLMKYCTSIEISMGSFNRMTFITDKKLLEQINQLLSSTSLFNRIIQK